MTFEYLLTSPALAASIPSFLSPRCLAVVKGANPKFDDTYDTQSPSRTAM